MTRKRVPLSFPDVPRVAETIPATSSLRGTCFAPKGVRRGPIVDRLNAELKKLLTIPTYRETSAPRRSIRCTTPGSSRSGCNPTIRNSDVVKIIGAKID